MNRHCRLSGALLTVSLVCVSAYGLDSAAVSGTQPINLSPAAGTSPVVGADQPVAIESFQVLQKKYLKKVVVTNLLYVAGFSLMHGVVMPRSRETQGASESMKLLPLSLLSAAMMYVSLPMSAATSLKAGNNYCHYYKKAPRNLAMHTVFTGLGLMFASTGLSYWQMYKDYRDNSESDGSYSKYSDHINGLATAATITWIGSNLYSLGYIVALGRMAEKNNPPVIALKVAPFRIRDANGLAVVYDF